ncbi:MAG TPA: cupin domain-containing protein [Candidatus Saccharimonadales bacterium]|nr:cupin domain-containing protein [Candidatus Saccharimonadales bacterium]
MKVLLDLPEITTKDKAISVDKGNGTKVGYYIFPEFEIHTNTIEPGTEQEWHHHKKIEEVLLVNSGELVALWQDSTKKIREKILAPGDMIRVGASTHTFANRGGQTVNFTVFRYVPDGQDKHELIKNDRYPDIVEET